MLESEAEGKGELPVVSLGCEQPMEGSVETVSKWWEFLGRWQWGSRDRNLDAGKSDGVQGERDCYPLSLASDAVSAQACTGHCTSTLPGCLFPGTNFISAHSLLSPTRLVLGVAAQLPCMDCSLRESRPA